MALRHFIFRCPSCGHDPMQGKGDTASCSACGCSITRGATHPLHLRVFDPARVRGPWHEVPAAELARQIEGHGGAIGPATRPDGRLAWAAEALLRHSSGEKPVRWQERLLGFFEAFAPGQPGTLRLEHDQLSFEGATGSGSDGGREGGSMAGGVGTGAGFRWELLSLRSLQSASSSVQFTTGQGDLVHLAFRDDSPRRWEALLRHALQRTWLEAGRGEIVDVQPRIRTRAARGPAQ
jgi:hypothetical protein